MRLTQQNVACRVAWRNFPAAVLLMPADIKVVGLGFEPPPQQPCGQCPDLAPLATLAQLEELSLISPIDQPIPQLPALRFLQLKTSDLQVLSSVTATLEWLVLFAPDINFGQPFTLAHFTRLKRLEWMPRPFATSSLRCCPQPCVI